MNSLNIENSNLSIQSPILVLSSSLNIPMKNSKLKPRYCCQCSYSTPYRKNLIAHIREYHIQCQICRWCDYSGFQEHVHQHQYLAHLDRIKQCNLCDYTACTQHRLDEHLKANHFQQYDIFCRLCDYSCITKKQLYEHISKEHKQRENIRYTCHYCNSSLTTNSDLKRHVQEVHDKLPVHEYRRKRTGGLNVSLNKYKCDVCEVRVSNKIKLKVHISLKHRGIHACGWCDYTTYKVKEMTQHVRTVHPKYHAFCKYCKHSERQKYMLPTHVKIVHDKIYDSLCSFCNAKFGTKKELGLHIKNKHDSIKI